MNKVKVISDVATFVSIQSVSADSFRHEEIKKAVEFLKSKLEPLGFTVETIEKTGANPLLIASRIVSDKAKTIGIYGHYDVQPEDPIDEWKTKPFDLVSKDGKFWGRGVADNKGHIIQNITAIEQLITNNQLTKNIVFIIEGEEEEGSVHFEEYVSQAKDLLSRADVWLVTDEGMHTKDVPLVFYGLRGLVYFELTVTIGERDLHSGVYGNRVLNPINVLSDLISKIKDVYTNKVLIPGFYDDVRKPQEEELKLLEKIAKTDEEDEQEASTYVVLGMDEKRAYLAPKTYPSFDCHGIIGGYTGEGSKTVIPRTAKVKFSFRLVEYQDPEKIKKMVSDFIKHNLPNGVKYHLECLSQAAPFYSDINNEYTSKVRSILREVFDNETLLDRSGGSVPPAEILQRLFKKPMILTGFILPDNNLHAPNENFDEEMFWKGIVALEKIYSNI